MTNSDYLWDKSGEPDAWVEALESTLAPLRFEPLARVPVRPIEVAEPAKTGGWLPVVAAVSTAAAVLLIAAGLSSLGGSSAVPAELEERWIPETSDVVAGVAGTAEELEAAEAAEDVEDVETVEVVEAAETVEVEPTEAPGQEDPAPETRRPRLREARAQPEPRSKKKHPPARPAKAQPESNEKGAEGSVDCILDPTGCDADADASLPDKLSVTDIRRVVGKLKREAGACRSAGELAGDRPPKVKIKLVIRGKTGRVLLAKAREPWAETSTGDCVEAVFARAEFPRFQAETMGVVYPILLRAQEPAQEEEREGDAAMSRALAPLRTKAKACGVLHDAKSGVRVKVKVWFDGKTGVVEAAKAMPPHTRTDLGRCLEAMVRKGKFPRTGKTGDIALVPFRM